MRKTSPILVIIYKRPELTKEVINSLELIKPRRIYVAADGPRNNREVQSCNEARRLFDNLGWKCEVSKKFSEENLGLRRNVSSAIGWFFSKENAGVILEDDCIADPSFFRFCSELLEKYQDDDRVMAIAGNNFQFGRKRYQNSYYFSSFAHCWGWATWKRAWKLYDDKLITWPRLRKSNFLKGIFPSDLLSQWYWKNIFDLVRDEKIDSWAYRWQFSCWSRGGLTILPSRNLVTNIGFGKASTNTRFKDISAYMKRYSMSFPLRHTNEICRDLDADNYTSKMRFIKPRVFGGLVYKKILSKIRKI